MSEYDSDGRLTVADCGHEVVTARPPAGTGGASGYARTADDRTLCYPCADSAQAADFESEECSRFVAYVSSDGRNLTTWTGGVLARTVWESNISRTPTGGEVQCYNFRDSKGRRWYGRGGGRGMCIAVRRNLAPRRA